MNKSFVRECDTGLHLQVLNIDDAFIGTTTGELARKCIEVAPRAVHMIGRDEAVILYEPLAESYCAYYETLYGHRPMVYFPSQRYTDLNEPLSLLELVLKDEELMERIGQDGRHYGWRLSPFIASPLLFELSRATGLPVAGIQEEAVRSDRVIELNDKAIFQMACRRLGIPIPDAVHVRGWKDLTLAIAKRIDGQHNVFLRRSRGAGGLGNFEVSLKQMSKEGYFTLREYLEDHLKPHDEWGAELILVEPVLDVVSSPGVLAYVEGDQIQIVGVIDQVLRDKAYIGGDFPSKESPEVCAKLIEWTELYLLEQFIPMGGQGWVNVDFGRCADDKCVAFESNARVTGSNHGLSVRKRLLDGLSESVHAWTHDALKVPPGTTFEDVIYALDPSILWDAERGDGVVITIPPGGNGEKFSMGYIALAKTDERKCQLRDAMTQFAEDRWKFDSQNLMYVFD